MYLALMVDYDSPIVLSWHYNLTGTYSNWWTDSEKDAFYEVIKGYNVLGIFLGHWHYSYTSEWHNIPVYGIGGSEFAKGTIIDNKLIVIYYDGSGPADVPFVPESQTDFPQGYDPC